MHENKRECKCVGGLSIYLRVSVWGWGYFYFERGKESEKRFEKEEIQRKKGRKRGDNW